MTLKTREPSGRPSHPCILIEGDEKSGKSWMAAQFTGNPRIGRALWIDLAEGDGELYGKIPGARYEIVEHDGTYASLYEAIADSHADARHAREAGDKPHLLTVDPVGAMWDLLSDWARNRAVTSTANKKLLAADPNAEINIGPTYWNPATERWRRCMTLLLTYPGIVLLLARGRETALIGPDGRPVQGRKDYRVEGHKSLAHDVTAWVRLTRGQDPQIIGGRSTKVDLRPDRFQGQSLKDFSLEWLIFEALGYDVDAARVRDHMEMKPGSDAPQSERAAVIEVAIDNATNEDELQRTYSWIGPALDAGEITLDEAKALASRVKARVQSEAVSAERVNGHRELAGASA